MRRGPVHRHLIFGSRGRRPLAEWCSVGLWLNAMLHNSRVAVRLLHRLKGALFLSAFMFLARHEVGAQSGLVDPGFNPGDGVDLSVYTILVQGNGQLFIGGDFTSFDNVERINVAHLNADGSRDDTFTPTVSSGASATFVNALALQQGGKLLVGGSFTNSAGTNLCRLLSNGNLDNTFMAQLDDTVTALVQQTNGSIVIGGLFTHMNGQPHAGIARTDSSGLLDTTFNPTLSGGLGAAALALQSDGKILVAGSFTNVNGTALTNLARLNTNGTLDATFKPVTMSGGSYFPALPGVLNCVAVDSQGRVIVGGDFTSVSGQARTNLARLNSDGSLDTNFSALASTDYAVWSIALESYGKIVIGGFFNMVNGVTNNYVAKLKDDGAIDPGFNTGLGPDDVVYSAVVQSDGKIVLGGGFVDIDTNYLSGIGRLLNTQTVSPPRLINPNFSNAVFRVSVPTYSGKTYILQYKNAPSDATWTSLPGVSGDGSVKVLTDSTATVPRRFYRASVQ